MVHSLFFCGPSCATVPSVATVLFVSLGAFFITGWLPPLPSFAPTRPPAWPRSRPALLFAPGFSFSAALVPCPANRSCQPSGRLLCPLHASFASYSFAAPAPRFPLVLSPPAVCPSLGVFLVSPFPSSRWLTCFCPRFHLSTSRACGVLLFFFLPHPFARSRSPVLLFPRSLRPASAWVSVYPSPPFSPLFFSGFPSCLSRRSAVFPLLPESTLFSTAFCRVFPAFSPHSHLACVRGCSLRLPPGPLLFLFFLAIFCGIGGFFVFGLAAPLSRRHVLPSAFAFFLVPCSPHLPFLCTPPFARLLRCCIPLVFPSCHSGCVGLVWASLLVLAWVLVLGFVWAWSGFWAWLGPPFGFLPCRVNFFPFCGSGCALVVFAVSGSGLVALPLGIGFGPVGSVWSFCLGSLLSSPSTRPLLACAALPSTLPTSHAQLYSFSLSGPICFPGSSCGARRPHPAP